MNQLYLPDSVLAEREQAAEAALAGEAQASHDREFEQFQMSLAAAYRAGYDLVRLTPRRLQAGINVEKNFWKWWESEVAL